MVICTSILETVEFCYLLIQLEPHGNNGGGFAARYRHEKLDGPVHFHYVAPSFWAWKGGEKRLKGLIESVDHILCILPNEDEVCKSNGLAATFVGHPILEDTLQLNVVSYVLCLNSGSCRVYKIILFELYSCRSGLHSCSFYLTLIDSV